MAGVQKANSVSRHARHHWCQMAGEGRACHMKPGAVENPVLGENEGEATCLKSWGGWASGTLPLPLLEEVAVMEKVNECLPRGAVKAQRQRGQSWGPWAILVFRPLIWKKPPSPPPHQLSWPCSPPPFLLTSLSITNPFMCNAVPLKWSCSWIACSDTKALARPTCLTLACALHSVHLL